ncbi:FtsX-like permease family protein [Azohydromonas sp.]|uniref:FtsX-like permease family protein n=1 Tax=Azohydromonas sp. TaxID=1872666 RepID=UPI002CBE02E3|nr:FtsX-like permease family protein [Azohydromonas sp.]HMM84398.1 FtsX-like permease family protein [Azohydromonas sp.]
MRLGLGFEWRVALRFLREGRFQTLLIVFGVAAGVAVVAYISALVSGLQRNTLDKTLGAQAHLAISPADERVTPVLPRAADGTPAFGDTQARAQRLRTIANWPALLDTLEAQPGVAAVSPMVSGAALASRGEATRSVNVAGVEIARYDRVVGLAAKTVAGALRLGPGEAIVGRTLADDLGVRVGDRITLATGTRAETLRLTALVDLGVTELNRRTVIVPLRSAQSLFDLTGGATRLEVTLADVWSAQALADELGRRWPLKVESWQQTNAQLVSALNAQSVSTALIRGVVMVVVVLGIASVLVVSVVQKQREIGILRAMGATRAQVMRVFLVQGAVVGAVGSVAGMALALAMIWAFTRFVRGSDGLPLFAITLPPALAVQVAAIAFVAGVLAAVAPARRAARLDPAQAIRL